MLISSISTKKKKNTANAAVDVAPALTQGDLSREGCCAPLGVGRFSHNTVEAARALLSTFLFISSLSKQERRKWEEEDKSC